MKCLETRATRAGKRRRYEADDGRRITTIEIPMEEWLQTIAALKTAESTAKKLRTRLRNKTENATSAQTPKGVTIHRMM